MSDSPPTSGLRPAAPSRAGTTARRWFAPLLAIPTPVIFIGAAAIAAFVLWQQGSLQRVGESVRSVPPWQAVAILLVYAASIFLLGVRWHVLVRLAGGDPPWRASAEVFLTSVIVNYAAPIGLAVPTRAALTVRDLGLTAPQSGAVVGWELGLDIAALLLISAGWLALGGSALLETMAIDVGVVAGGGAVLALLIIGAAILSRHRGLRERSARLLGPMLAAPRRHPLVAVVAMAMTIAYWATQVAVMAALLGVFGVPPTPVLVLGLMGLPVLIGMLSPVPGGAGVREALMAAMAGLEGVPAGPVVLAAIAYRLALFVVTPVVWGVLRLTRSGAGRMP